MTMRRGAAAGAAARVAPGWALAMAMALASPTAADTLVARGEKVFVQCAGCHAVARGRPTMAGPNLAGVVGRVAGADATFSYSPAFRRAAARRLTWTPAELDRFLANPGAVVPQTSMASVAVKSAGDRKALIAYLGAVR